MRRNPRDQRQPTSPGRRRFLQITGAAVGAGTFAPGVAGAAPTTQAVEDPEWSELYDNDGNEDVAADIVVSTRDGGYAVLGTTYSYSGNQFSQDLWLVKIDEEGGVEWTETYDNDQNYEYAAALVETRRPNGYAIAATTSDPNTGTSSIWFGRTNSDGDLGPTQTYDYSDTSYDTATDMVAVSSGRGSRRRTRGFAILGETSDTGIPGGSDLHLLRIGLGGSLDWNETYSYADDSYDTAYGGALVRTSDGGYALFGNTYSTTGSGTDYYLQKTDQSGDPEWSESYDRDTTEDYSADLVERRSGGETSGYVLVGTSWSTDFTTAYYWALRLDDEGGVQRNQTYQCRDHNYNYAAALTSAPDDDGYAILGTTYTNDTSDGNYCVVRTNNNLAKQWDREYDYGTLDTATSITQNDDGYALAGYTYNNTYDFWVVGVSDDEDNGQ